MSQVQVSPTVCCPIYLSIIHDPCFVSPHVGMEPHVKEDVSLIYIGASYPNSLKLLGKLVK